MHAHLLGIIAIALDATGLFEEAEQLGLSQEVQAARQMLQQRQHAAVEALQVAAMRADAAAFASALSAAWLVLPSPKPLLVSFHDTLSTSRSFAVSYLSFARHEFSTFGYQHDVACLLTTRKHAC